MEENEDATMEDDDEVLDLLDQISEDSGEAWRPADDEDQPQGIQITITFISTVEDAYGNDIPLIEGEDKDGTLWSLRAYHTALRSQLSRHDLEVGGTLAVKYLGPKPNKKGDNEYYDYRAKYVAPFPR